MRCSLLSKCVETKKEKNQSPNIHQHDNGLEDIQWQLKLTRSHAPTADKISPFQCQVATLHFTNPTMMECLWNFNTDEARSTWKKILKLMKQLGNWWRKIGKTGKNLTWTKPHKHLVLRFWIRWSKEWFKNGTRFYIQQRGKFVNSWHLPELQGLQPWYHSWE